MLSAIFGWSWRAGAKPRFISAHGFSYWLRHHGGCVCETNLTRAERAYAEQAIAEGLVPARAGALAAPDVDRPEPR